MNKIGICTLYTGYNFGSALQAFATSNILKENGYTPEVLKVYGSLIPGRDVRLNKAIITLGRMIIFSKNKTKILKSFSQNKKSNINDKTIREFDEFYNNYLNPKIMKYNKLKKIAKMPEYKKFICGSDQIWNSTAFYVDPFYYLRFAPKYKRVAYAPSFGRDYVAKYNKKKIKKYINDFDALSIREDSGKQIVKDLTNRDIPVCLDPTLLMDKEKWKNILNLKDKKEKYIFTYFLSTPSKKARYFIDNLSKEKNLKVIAINNKKFNDVIYGGPISFLNYLLNAEYVITDSFHGVAFSINFNKNFYVFEREYATESQSTRITSLLNKANLNYLFEPDNINDKSIDYNVVNKLMNKEREQSINYLVKNIKGE